MKITASPPTITSVVCEFTIPEVRLLISVLGAARVANLFTNAVVCSWFRHNTHAYHLAGKIKTSLVDGSGHHINDYSVREDIGDMYDDDTDD